MDINKYIIYTTFHCYHASLCSNLNQNTNLDLKEMHLRHFLQNYMCPHCVNIVVLTIFKEIIRLYFTYCIISYTSTTSISLPCAFWFVAVMYICQGMNFPVYEIRRNWYTQCSLVYFLYLMFPNWCHFDDIWSLSQCKDRLTRIGILIKIRRFWDYHISIIRMSIMFDGIFISRRPSC